MKLSFSRVFTGWAMKYAILGKLAITSTTSHGNIFTSDITVWQFSPQSWSDPWGCWKGIYGFPCVNDVLWTLVASVQKVCIGLAFIMSVVAVEPIPHSALILLRLLLAFGIYNIARLTLHIVKLLMSLNYPLLHHETNKSTWFQVPPQTLMFYPFLCIQLPLFSSFQPIEIFPRVISPLFLLQIAEYSIWKFCWRKVYFRVWEKHFFLQLSAFCLKNH